MENEELKNRIIKIIFFSIVLIVVALIIAYIIFFKFNNSKQYLIINNNLIWQKTGSTFTQIKEMDKKISKLKFTISDGESTKSNIRLQFTNNMWYFFDSQYNQIEMPNFRIATHDLDIKLANYKRETITNVNEDSNVIDYLNKKNVVAINSYRGNKYVYDFDQDGKEEIIYTLTNSSLSSVDYVMRSFIFMVKDNKVYEIDSQEKSPYLLVEILDVDNDNQYEMIVSNNIKNLSTLDSCYRLYKLKNSDWQIKQDCQ